MLAGMIQAAEEVWFLSFRGACSAEESLFLLDLDRGEIPRLARNDKKFEFFRSLMITCATQT